MHIALVNQWYPPETGGGGVATYNYFFANSCIQRNHQITVIAARLNRETPGASEQNGVRVLRVRAPNFYRLRRLPIVGRQYRFVQALVYSYRVCLALRRLHSVQPVDIVEFAEVNAEGLFWRHRVMGNRMVVRCHTPAWVLERYYTRTEIPYDASLLGRAEKCVIRRADALTAPSRDLANLISKDVGIDARRIHPIPNSLDTDYYAPPAWAETERRGPDAPVTVLWVGRLERAKGADILIEAIPRVCRELPNMRFVIIGGARPHPHGGTYHDYMRKQLAPQISSGRVDIRGFVPEKDMLEAYHRSDICVVPSLLYESFSYTVAQAMSCGLPVIASRIGGIPETLDDGRCGVLVEPGNIEQFTESLIDLGRDPTRRARLGESARTYATSHFSPENVSSLVLGVYQQALGIPSSG